MLHVLFNWSHAQCLVYTTVTPHLLDTCYNTLTLFIFVLGLCTYAQLNPFNPFNDPFYPDVTNAREKKYQALSCFFVLQVMETWAEPGNKATDYISLVAQWKLMPHADQKQEINLCDQTMQETGVDMSLQVFFNMTKMWLCYCQTAIKPYNLIYLKLNC